MEYKRGNDPLGLSIPAILSTFVTSVEEEVQFIENFD